MAQVEKTVLVPYSAAQMFALVDDVESYPQFLPWCGGVDLIERTEVATEATLHINYHGVKQNFTTRNAKQFPTRMDITLVNGPFSQMEGNWQFIPLTETACKVEFRLQYTFANGVLEMLISPVFNLIAAT
ncbi:MAG TPA: type II toxin-antitoxin system RatA family toxin, partial [Methylophilaceae bacterium]